MASYDPSWMLTEPVLVTTVDDAGDYGCATRVRIRSLTDAAGSYREVELRYELGNLTFNTVRADVGDDLMSYLSLMDEAGTAGPGHWVRSEPYSGNDPAFTYTTEDGRE